MIRIKSDRIITSNGLFDGYVYIDNGVIAEVSGIEKAADKCFDFSGKFVSPGFIDMHTHGGGGFAFMNNTLDDVVNGDVEPTFTLDSIRDISEILKSN